VCLTAAEEVASSTSASRRDNEGASIQIVDSNSPEERVKFEHSTSSVTVATVWRKVKVVPPVVLDGGCITTRFLAAAPACAWMTWRRRLLRSPKGRRGKRSQPASAGVRPFQVSLSIFYNLHTIPTTRKK